MCSADPAAWIAEAKLWLVLDRAAAAPRSLPEVTGLCINGGVDAVLCRIKDAPVAEVRSTARDVREVCRQLNTPFVMSHYPELASELSADAVQLGVADPGLAEVRKWVGDMPVGYSTHSVAEARQRFSAGASYVFLGPVFATPSKLKYGEPLGLGVVPEANALSGPVVFIGGISSANLGDLCEQGAERIAMIRALQSVVDPKAAAAELRSRL